MTNCVCDLLGRREETEQLIGTSHNFFSIFFYTLTGVLHFVVFRDNVTDEINDALSNQIEYQVETKTILDNLEESIVIR